ncbi:amidohydrolase family protein [Novosphingobium sp. BL-8A]|uniref:N-acyl-D-amino-acid deacylase family protein n=1 Tax=unclassified Novosphingobium TaxID=2644732 RepID=UPI0037568E54
MPDADLIIRGGTIVDGTGGNPFVADIAVLDGRISAIGANLERAREEIDANGLLVTPGFIDIHTHYDGQVTWSDSLVPSAEHGVTSVVIGNCGVGFAPCRAGDREALVNVMEGVEDIPEAVMATGLPWNWETFPEYLEALGNCGWDVDVGAYIPHSPLRVYAMGQRGLDREAATPADIVRLSELVSEAMDAGALGFATSRSLVHRRGDGAFIPSFQAACEELEALARAVGESGRGVIQMIPNLDTADWSGDIDLMKRMACASGRPVTYSLAQWAGNPDGWRQTMDALLEHNRSGAAPILAQVFPRLMGALCGLSTSANAFSYCRTYRALEDLPLPEKVRLMRDSRFRERLVAEEPDETPTPLHALLRTWDNLFPLGDEPDYEPSPDSSIASLAKRRGIEPAELAYELMLEQEGKSLILMPFSNYAQCSLDPVLAMMKDPCSIIGLGDGGAHYGIICDASYPTTMLAYWARDRAGERLSVAAAVKALSADNAAFLGLHDRGRLAQGLKADINLIDHAALRLHAPYVVHDLPGGGRRLAQHASGYRATMVSGVITRRDGVDTGARPGRLIRAT